MTSIPTADTVPDAIDLRRASGESGGGPDSGYILILTALLMIPLLALTALAVDLGAWYAQGARIQRAADSGALAGVVWASDPTKWDTVARDTISRNGFTDGVNGTTVAVQRISDSQIRADIQVKGMQFFSSIFIPGGTRINREAVAEYVVPVPMGSPKSSLGNDPTLNITQPEFWLNIAGQGADKANGDRNHALNCASATWGCSGGRNTEYRPDGYFYKLSVGSVTPGQPLDVAVYDPAFVMQGDSCGSGNLPTSGSAQYLQQNNGWCTGDNNVGGNNIITTYIVRAPDNTPLDNTDNPAICAISFSPYDSSVTTLLANPANQGLENVPFSSHFHTWFRLCRIPSGSVQTGDYYIQVRTNADQTNRGSTPATTATSGLSIGTLGSAANPGTGGHNRFAMRAGWGGDPTVNGYGTGLGLAADGRFPIYVNASQATTNFYLARITPDYAGKTLQLSLWDIGDVGGTPGTADMTIQMPGDALNPPTTCTFTRDGGAMTGVTVSNCTVRGVTSANYNGRIIQVTMNMPAGYTCSSGDPNGCWFKINITYNGTPQDTTTWSANVIGDPVHLIK
jgi:hypothetical protein